ncbi:hypothetical protein IV203_023123 [Nitzschia inconspicua]|uniref:Uncharacterized protein n=1 Tax=Nitzschia inconspicua TaxID=303405 RepID=A0A9K3PB72_9STRA|nr:hypothetical protein IV203_023123 [Nitzschia inconspicua]
MKIQRGMLLLSFLWIHVVNALTDNDVKAPRRRQQQQQFGFRWLATLDRTTGLASSTETSTFLLSHDKVSQSNPPRSKPGIFVFPFTRSGGKRRETIRSISNDFVATWPDFLCQSSVTFGLFRSKKHHQDVSSVQSNHNRNKSCLGDDVTSIQPTLLPFRLSLLDFGKVQPCLQQPQQGRRNRDGTTVDHILGCWEIPIQGGLLAMASPTKDGYHGKLTFSISKKLMVSSNSSRGIHAECFQLSTHIIDYAPWLAGSPPISRIRKELYLHTQSYVHAYTTWRFHKAWQRKLQLQVL